MHLEIAIDKLLLPIHGDSPSGSDLRYTTYYEEIMEARRSEDAVALGDWRHSVKTSDWEKVIGLCVAALSEKSKDLQISAWLVEALTVVDGFGGLELGLRLTRGLLDRFWDTVYPLTGDGDLEYRAAPFEFLNEKVALQVKQVALTENGAASGYSWIDWHQSRLVGYDADTVDRYGATDEEKKGRRDAHLAENALAAEEFDAAAARSNGDFSQALLDGLQRCRESLSSLTSLVGERFGSLAPDLAGLDGALEGCSRVARNLYAASAAPPAVEEDKQSVPAVQPALRPEATPEARAPEARPLDGESVVWREAVAILEAGRLQEALGLLQAAKNGSASAREMNRVRLLMAKLCLLAGRYDLARPMVEELHGMIQELQLERWESAEWIAEVLDAYYRCLQAGALGDEDQNLCRVLFRKICTLDVTKAIPHGMI